jgi:formate dehydrogenase major subunit
MTNHWVDLKNADVFMICGANPSENHPCCWKWLEKAREERDAKIIVVDPRFTRSAARADFFAFIRPGTDIAFFGALIKYAIDKNYLNWEYVQNFTNAPIKVNPDYKGPGELDGLFSGYNAETRKYDIKTWSYQADAAGEPTRVALLPIAEDPLYKGRGVPNGPMDSSGNFIPNGDAAIAGTVFAKLKEHYSRYTYEGDDSIVSRVCGMSPESFKAVAEAYVGITHKRDKSGNLMYAMGLTQFTIGTEKIRTFAILQGLLGNTGMPGGGINALRGESNVQGSTDFALLSHILNGYIAVPNSTDNPDLTKYLEKITPKAGYWVNTPKFIKSYLMAYWGPYAKANSLDKAFDLHPKVKKGKNYTHIGLFEDMYAGIIKGCIAWGQNPVVGGANANLEAAAMDKLDWFVAADLWETESMNFWRRPGTEPKDIQTEVWVLPAASSVEKPGSVTNSGRLAQYRWKAVEPPGEAEPDAWMMHQIMKALKELYTTEGGPAKEAVTELFWAYDEDENGEPNLDQVLLEIQGFIWPSGEFSWEEAFKKPVFGFGNLKDDGSTCCGNWIFSGEWASDTDVETAAKILGIDGQLPKDSTGKVVIPRDNQALEWNGISFDKAKWHFQKTPVYYLGKDGTTIYTENPPSDAKMINVGTNPVWAWSWPVNRRIIYNRGSCDYSGKPFAPNKALFTFKEDGNLGMKNDVNDFYLPADLTGKVTLVNYSGANPFIMNKEVGALVARLFSNSLLEGPFPEHYEPRESPVNNVISGTQNNPIAVLDWPSAKEDPEKWGFAEIGDPKYPYIGTTYRVTEHWQAGQMTRNNSWLGEAMPEQFVEISVELADELGIKSGDLVEMESKRGKMQGIAVVTVRLKPLIIGDNGSTRTVHIVGTTWHYGYIGLFTGGPERNGFSKKNYASNQLTGHVGDGNTTIPESKAFLVNLRKVN